MRDTGVFLRLSLANTTNNPQHMVCHKNGMFRLKKMENFFFSLQLTRNKYTTVIGQLGRAQLVIHQLNMYAVSSAALQSTWQWQRSQGEKKKECGTEARIMHTTAHPSCVVRQTCSSSIERTPGQKTHARVHTQSGKCCGCPSRQRCRTYHRQCCRRRCRQTLQTTPNNRTGNIAGDLAVAAMRSQAAAKVAGWFQFCLLNALHLTAAPYTGAADN